MGVAFSKWFEHWKRRRPLYIQNPVVQAELFLPPPDEVSHARKCQVMRHRLRVHIMLASGRVIKTTKSGRPYAPGTKRKWSNPTDTSSKGNVEIPRSKHIKIVDAAEIHSIASSIKYSIS